MYILIYYCCTLNFTIYTGVESSNVVDHGGKFSIVAPVDQNQDVQLHVHAKKLNLEFSE